MKLLLVEQESIVQHQLESCLKDFQHQLQRINDTSTLLSLLDPDSSTSNAYDVILIDSAFPKLNIDNLQTKIIQACIKLRIPLIFLGKSEQDSNLIQCLAEGGDDFLLTPINDQAFRLKIQCLERLSKIFQNLNQAKDELSRLSLIDPVTQLPNLRSFEQEIVKQWCQMKREALPLSVIHIDMDFFDHYVEIYGAQEGNASLRMLAMLLEGGLSRPMDTVAHIKGDLFGVLLPQTDLEGALKVAHAMMRHVQEAELPFVGAPNNHPIICISMGVVSFNGPELKSFNTQYFERAASAALLEAKKQGGNRISSTAANQLEAS